MIALLVLAVSATPAGNVGYRVDDVQLDLGNVHLSAGVGASVLGNDQVVYVGGAAVVELAPFWSVTGMGGFPIHDLGDSDSPWSHLEAGIALHTTNVQRTTQPVILEQSSYTSGDTRTTNTISVNMPVSERVQLGLGVGALFRQGQARLGKEDSSETPSTHLMPYAGVFWSSAIGQSARLEGYGRREVYRFVWGGADLVYAGVHSYEIAPTGPLNDFGLRMHIDALWGRPGTLGMGGRFEIGALPGGLQGYLLASLSLTTNLRVGMGRGERRVRRPRSRSGKPKGK